MAITARTLAAALAAAALTAPLAACSGEGGGSTGGGTNPSVDAATSVPVAASAGCDENRGPAVLVNDARVTVTSGGQERWYLQHLPPSYDGSTAMPLVVDIHGYAEGAEIHVRMSELGAFGDEQGFVTLTPQGQGEVPHWDTALGSPDLAFVGDLLDSAERSLCVDTNRIYVAGLSNGAFMASAVACQYADRVAAVAPVAGISQTDGCDPARPVPVVTFHGTADAFVSFEGGLGEAVGSLPAPDGSGLTLGETGAVTTAPPAAGDDAHESDAPSVPEIAAAWARRNGCGDEPALEEVAEDVAVERFDCPPGADVELYRIEGGGHAWPGSEFSAGIESIVGTTTMSISANEVMWDFFRAHPLSPTPSRPTAGDAGA